MSSPDVQTPMELMLYRNPDEFRSVFAEFIEAGPENVLLASDNDKTLTRNSRNRALHGLPSGWHVLHEALESEEDKAIDLELAAQYAHREGRGDKEDDGGLSPELAMKWWKQSGSLHIGKTRESRLREMSFRHMRFRPEVLTLLNDCHKSGIFFSIVSAGIKNVIEFGLDAQFEEERWRAPELRNGAVPILGTRPGLLNRISEPTESRLQDRPHPLIIANELIMDEYGVARSWEPAEMITSRNKIEAARRGLSVANELRPYIILLGDSLEDALVVPDPPPGTKGRVIRTRMADWEEGVSTSLTPEFVEETWAAGYDAIAVHSLYPVVRQVRQVAAGAGGVVLQRTVS